MFNIVRLEALIKEKGWSKTYFADQLGKNKGWITDMKRGVGLPDRNIIEQIAELLGTTADYLLDKTDNKNKPALNEDELTPDEMEFLKIVRQLSPEGKAELRDYALYKAKK